MFEHADKPEKLRCGISRYRRYVSAAKRADVSVLRFDDLTQATSVFNVYEG